MSEYGPAGLPQSGLDGEMTAWLTDLLIFNLMIDDDHLNISINDAIYDQASWQAHVTKEITHIN